MMPPKAQQNLYIGLMSGTSMDGIDAVLVSFENEKTNLIATHTISIPEKTKSNLKILMRGEDINLKLLGETDTQLGKLFADAVLQLLKNSGFSAEKITAIGSHGQTIYHAPNHDHPFTLQIGDVNIIAALTKITTVADFRRRDIALGGQGAPLVPAFHEYLFSNRGKGSGIRDQSVVNIGGIANITYLPTDNTKSIIGFDTGPGNTLLDRWCEKHRNLSCDLNGDWARSGKIIPELLEKLLDDDYFKKPFPKSTGREYFNLDWLHQKIPPNPPFSKGGIAPQDMQATLTELTAKTIADAILTHTHTIWLCGGGTYNTFLIERLQHHLPRHTIKSTSEMGIDPQWMEATAFAWLAKRTLEKKSGNCKSVTGASQQSILGGVYYG